MDSSLAYGFNDNNLGANQFSNRLKLITVIIRLLASTMSNKFAQMKIYIYALLCFLLFSCGQSRNAEPTTVVVPDSVATKTDSAAAVNSSADTIIANPTSVIANPTSVLQIRQRFAVINDKLQRTQLDSISFKYDCNEERSGTVTYFSEQGKLVLVKHSYSEYSHFSAVDDYFISNDKLFFAHLNRRNWSFESGQAVEGATIDNIIEQRLYLANDKALLCLEKKYTTRSHAAANPIPANLPNKQVTCKSTEPLIKDFKNLIDYQRSNNHDCLEK